MNKKLYSMLIIVLMLAHQTVFSSIVLRGDSAATPTETFSFPILRHVFSPTNNALYVGARLAGAETFALSKLVRGTIQFTPLAPQYVTFNYVNESINPLFDKGISLLTVLTAEQGHSATDRLIVTTTDPQQIANIYLVEQPSATAPLLVQSVDDIVDALGLKTTGILSLAATSGGRSGAFAAVKSSAGGTFGNLGSGIALVQLQEVKFKDGDKEISRIVFQQIPAQFGTNILASAAFYTASPFLKITNDLTSMTNIVSVHWSQLLQRVFVAFQGQAGAGANDGLRAVAVGRVDNNGKLIFEPIAPASVFTAGANNEIVGAVGALSQVSIQQIRTMRTSTGLDYAIILGGNGAPGTTESSVFAVPLVNSNKNQATQGTLANINSAPVAEFRGCDPAIFTRRALATPATTPADIFTTADFQARVGGGALLAGPIHEILIAKDTVFAAVGEPAGVTQLPGVFYSQAIFDEQGLIKNWTQWRRAAGTTDKVFGIDYEQTVGSFYLFSGSSVDTINTVSATFWSNGSITGLQSMGTFLTSIFPPALGGIQALFDYPVDVTPGIIDMSVMIATGFKKICLLQTGSRMPGGPFVPSSGAFVENRQEFTQGVITPAANAKVLVISGGALNDLAAIVTTEIGVSGANGWLFAGGTGGLAVLANPDGTGWNSGTSLQPSFVGLTDGMLFKTIGDYSFVRSLVADDNFLYVLSDTRFDRIDMGASNFATGDLAVTTLATLSDPSIFSGKGTLLDILVSQKFALLSTTTGLYRVGNGGNIRTAGSSAAVGWTPVKINEGAGSAIQLIPLSVTGRQQNVATHDGGGLYALNGYTGQSRGQVNRFTVQDVTSSPITDLTIQAVPDIFVEGIPSYFKNFGGFANQVATDGSVLFYTRCRNLLQPPFMKSSTAVLPVSDFTIPLAISQFSNITRVLRSSASGSWMVAGDFVRFNE